MLKWMLLGVTRKFAATDVKSLRAAVGTFCDLLGLAARTMEAFPPQVAALS